MDKSNKLPFGFSDLLGTDANLSRHINCNKVIEVDVDNIVPCNSQPRKFFEKDELLSLSRSIQHSGIIQPLIVSQKNDKYELIAGERRWRAARMCDLKYVPCVILDVAEEEVAVMALVENIQRADLNPIEEAMGYKKLYEDFHLSHEQISESVGKPRSSITNSLRLLNLPQDIQQYLIEGRISFGHGKLLLSLPYERQKEVADIVISKGFTVRKLEEYIKKMSNNAIEPKEQKCSSIDTTAIERQLKEIFGMHISVEIKKNSNKKITFSDEFVMNGLMDVLKY